MSLIKKFTGYFVSHPPARPLRRVGDYFAALMATVALAVLVMPLRHYLDLANIIMMFLLVVFLVALKLGRGPAVLASFASVLLFDYVFVPPHLELIPADAQHLLMLAVMLAVALVTAQLTAGAREQAELAYDRERQTQRMYRLARDLAGAASLWDVQQALDAYLQHSGCRAMLYMLDERYGAPPAAAQEPMAGFVREVIRLGEPQACERCGPALFLPIKATENLSGVMVVSASGEPAMNPQREQERFMVVASLVAIVIERLHYVEIAQQTQVEASSERLRASLLSALSHDLRTPLTVLVGLAESLALAREGARESTQEIATAIRRQAQEMDNLLGNLLDMARLQAGRVTLRKEWQLFDDVIGPSLRLLKLSQSSHPVRVNLAPDLPLVEFDAVLMERVIWNLLENAAKYSPPGAAIEINAYVEGHHACLAICDHGPGFPPGMSETVFEMFERGDAESAIPGMGLGLAICRAIVDAHGGTIKAHNRAAGGACVTIQLPLGNPPVVEDEEGSTHGGTPWPR